MRHFLVGLAVCSAPSAALATESPAAATPSSSEAKTGEGRANKLAYDAKEHFERGDYAQARSLFQRAQELAQSPVFDLYIGRSERALGHYRDAALAYRRAAAAVVDETNLPWVRAQRDALLELDALEREAPKLSVTLTAASAVLAINARLDGEPCAWPIRELWVEPGPHRLQLQSGATTVERVFEAAPLKTTQLGIDWPAAARAIPPANEPDQTLSRTASPPREPRHGSQLAPYKWTSLGLAAVAAATGAATGVMVLNETASLRAWCKADGHVCRGGEPQDPEQQANKSKAERWATVSNVAFVVAGAASLGTVVLFALDHAEPRQRARIQLGVEVGQLTVSGRF